MIVSRGEKDRPQDVRSRAPGAVGPGRSGAKRRAIGRRGAGGPGPECPAALVHAAQLQRLSTSHDSRILPGPSVAPSLGQTATPLRTSLAHGGPSRPRSYRALWPGRALGRWPQSRARNSRVEVLPAGPRRAFGRGHPRRIAAVRRDSARDVKRGRDSPAACAPGPRNRPSASARGKESPPGGPERALTREPHSSRPRDWPGTSLRAVGSVRRLCLAGFRSRRTKQRFGLGPPRIARRADPGRQAPKCREARPCGHPEPQPSRHGLLGRAGVSPSPRTPRRSAAGEPLRRKELSVADVRPRRRLAS